MTLLTFFWKVRVLNEQVKISGFMNFCDKEKPARREAGKSGVSGPEANSFNQAALFLHHPL